MAILDYTQQSLPEFRLTAVAIVSTLVLGCFSVFLMFADAEWQPYYGPIQPWQMLCIVGGSSVLFAAWIAWLLWLVWAVWYHKLHRVWLAAISIAVVLMVGCSMVALGYARDVAKGSPTPGSGAPASRPCAPATCSASRDAP